MSNLKEVIKDAPPVGVTGLYIFGIPINEAVLILTGIYTIFLIIDKLPTMALRLKQFKDWLYAQRKKP
jgi:hypothetical protein